MKNFIIGEKASFEKTISESDVYNYAGITGDMNPIHISKINAESTMFKERIAHGLLVGGFISTVIGMYLPGPGAIYMEQNFKFTYPVKIGDTVRAIVEVEDIVNREKGIIKLLTTVINQDNKIVIEGYAVVKV